MQYYNYALYGMSPLGCQSKLQHAPRLQLAHVMHAHTKLGNEMTWVLDLYGGLEVRVKDDHHPNR